MEINDGSEKTDAEKNKLLEIWFAVHAGAPVPSEIIVSLTPGVSVFLSLPTIINSPRAACEYARDYAGERMKKVFLKLSPGFTVWFGEDGRIESITDAGKGDLIERNHHSKSFT